MYTHILVATDGSELATKGLDHAISLAKRLEAKLTVVTITEPTLPSASATGAVWVPAWDPTELDKAKADAAASILESATKAASAAGLSAQTLHVPDMYPAEGIVHAAEEKGANLIVIASHGRRGLGRLLLGSQATEVLSHSKVPVLVIK
jgi:nucleotide-binding universal stress UspA family protein